MVNKKTRRHSGRYTPNLVRPQMPYNKIKEDALEPSEEYDNWIEYRDGSRDADYLRRKKRDKNKFPYKRGGRKR